MYFNPVSCHLMFFSHKIKCNIEPPSKTTSSTSSQITGAVEAKSVVAAVNGGFSAFTNLSQNN